MSPERQVLLSSALTFGVPLLLAIREVIVTRKRRGGGGWRERHAPEPPRPKPLPDCLIPRRPVYEPELRERTRRAPELV